MDPPMRRLLLVAAIVAPVLAGAGCHKNIVTGRCDCTNDPANGLSAAPSNPYPVISGPASSAAVPAPVALEKAVMPEKMPEVVKPKN